MIGIFQVFLIELPIAFENVAMHAEKFQRAPVEDGIELIQHLRTEIVFERFDVVAKRRKYDAVSCRHVETSQRMIALDEVGGHAAFTLNAPAKGDGHQRAAEIVCPLMVRTDELLGRSAVALAEFDAAVRASVLEGTDVAALVARHDDGNGADVGSDVIAGVRKFDVERDVIPGPSPKDLLLLQIVDGLVGIDPVGNF